LSLDLDAALDRLLEIAVGVAERAGMFDEMPGEPNEEAA
jgi:hypothetical protein